jgi:hypothetical protein
MARLVFMLVPIRICVSDVDSDARPALDDRRKMTKRQMRDRTGFGLLWK